MDNNEIKIEGVGDWRTPSEVPKDGTFVLLTLVEDGDRWVEPGQYAHGRFQDIHRVPFREILLAWMPFPKAYEG